MKTDTLKKIKIVENDHILKILFVLTNNNIPIDTLLSLKDFGNITIAVSSPMISSEIIGKVRGMKNYTVVLMNRVPICNYDLLMTNIFSNQIEQMIDFMKIKYVMFLMNSKNFNMKNYKEYDTNCFKYTIDSGNENIKTFSLNSNNPVILNESEPNDEENPSVEDEPVYENTSKNYDIFIKSLASTEINYDKYKINYLHALVPGKVSIIMIVSVLNNKFAETIRGIKAQNIPAIEYIIIDNASGFRNNVKPNIRYGEKMPEEYCIYHAKELASGEYMIILNQDSDEIDVLYEISKGQYEVR